MDIVSAFNLTVNLSQTKITSIINISTICCPVCAKPLTTRYRNINCFHVTCNDCILDTKRCRVCDSLITRVEILHPNEELYICPRDGCKKGFINFSSVSYHVEIYHNQSEWIGTEVLDHVNNLNYQMISLDTKDYFKSLSDTQIDLNKNEIFEPNTYSSLIEDDYIPKPASGTALVESQVMQSSVNTAIDDSIDIHDLENLM